MPRRPLKRRGKLVPPCRLCKPPRGTSGGRFQRPHAAPLDGSRTACGTGPGASRRHRAAQAEPRGKSGHRHLPAPPPPFHPLTAPGAGSGPSRLASIPERSPAAPSPGRERRMTSPARAPVDGPPRGRSGERRGERAPPAPAHLSTTEHGGGRAVPRPPPPPPPGAAQTGRVPAWLLAGPAAARSFRRCHDPASAARHTPAASSAAPRRHLERGPACGGRGGASRGSAPS